jgi:hypothetical protein
MGLHGPPFYLNFRMVPDKFEQILIAPLTEGTFVIVKNLHPWHKTSSLFSRRRLKGGPYKLVGFVRLGADVFDHLHIGVETFGQGEKILELLSNVGI